MECLEEPSIANSPSVEKHLMPNNLNPDVNYPWTPKNLRNSCVEDGLDGGDYDE